MWRLTFWLGNVLCATTACTFSTCQLPKVVRTWCALYNLTWKCASRHNGVHFFNISTSKSGPNPTAFALLTSRCALRHNGVHFFNISTSKSGPNPTAFALLTSRCALRHNGVHFLDISTSKSASNLVCFVHFDLEMCVQRQKSGPNLVCFVHFEREMCVQRQKVVRTWCALYILTWKFASRQNGIHFFIISTSKSGPNLVCFVHFDLETCFAPQRRALFPHVNFQKWSEPGVLCTIWLGNVLRATTACTFSTSQLPKAVRIPQFLHFWLRDVLCATTAYTFWTSQLPKVLRTWCALYTLTWKCVFNVKKVVRTWCALYTLKGKCAFNVKKWSEPGVLCTFWLGNLLRARTASTFSSSQLQKVVRTWFVLYILTWKRASRHNGVQFLISHLASWLRTRPFSEPTFRPSGATNHWKNTMFRDFATFSRTWIFFLLRLTLFFFLLLFSSLTLPISAFHLSILSEIWLLNFILLDIYIYIYLFFYLYLNIYFYIYIYISYIYIYHHIYIYISYIYMKTMRFSSIFPIFPSRNKVFAARPSHGPRTAPISSPGPCAPKYRPCRIHRPPG